MWSCGYKEVLTRVNEDIPKFCGGANIHSYTPCAVRSTNSYNKDTDLQCKVRDWRNYDVEYWASYGITLEWLKYAEVYPISHKIIIKMVIDMCLELINMPMLMWNTRKAKLL